MAEALKEVLVVLGERSRPVLFEGTGNISTESNNLVEAAKKVFEDILQSGSHDSRYYFQVESVQWNGQLIDMVAPLKDGDIVYMFKESKVGTVPDLSGLGLCWFCKRHHNLNQ